MMRGGEIAVATRLAQAGNGTRALESCSRACKPVPPLCLACLVQVNVTFSKVLERGSCNKRSLSNAENSFSKWRRLAFPVLFRAWPVSGLMSATLIAA